MNSTEICKICGSYGENWAEGKGFRVLRCPRCGLLWVDRVERQEGDYWAEGIYLEIEPALERRYRKFLRRILKIAKKTGRALEVGSSVGTFLRVAGEMGFDIQGCDISPSAVKFAQGRGFKVRLGTLNDEYPDEEFDFVFAFNLVEHLSQPSSFFTHARRVLKKGGYLVVETPVQDSLFHRAARFAYFLSGGRLKFLGLSPRDHLIRFSRETFEEVSRRFGLRLVSLWQMPSPWKEIWRKSSKVKMERRWLYRLLLPPLWLLSLLPGQGNRALAVFRKPL